MVQFEQAEPLPKPLSRLISNIIGSLKSVPQRIQELQIRHFYKADPAYGPGMAKGLGLDIEKIAASIDNMVAAD